MIIDTLMLGILILAATYFIGVLGTKYTLWVKSNIGPDTNVYPPEVPNAQYVKEWRARR